jgi:hypothetical protein
LSLVAMLANTLHLAFAATWVSQQQLENSETLVRNSALNLGKFPLNSAVRLLDRINAWTVAKPVA